jgi:MFS family permease
MIHRHRPARVVVPLGLAICLSPLGDLALYAVLVTQMDVVGLTMGMVGIMLGVNRLIRIPANPLAGVVFDRGGRRPLFLLGMVLGVLSTAGYAFLRGFWPFLLARLAWGLAWTLLSVGGLSMVLDVSTPANRGRWMGVYNTSILIGLALGPTIGGVLVQAIGFQGGMIGCAAITAAGLAVALVALPETAAPSAGQKAAPSAGQKAAPSAGQKAAQSASQTAAQQDGRRGGWWPRLGPILLRGRQLRPAWDRLRSQLRANPNLLTAGALYFIVQFTGEGVVLSTISLLLQQRFGPQLMVGSLAVGVAAAGGLVLGLRSALAGLIGPLAGHLSDTRFGRWPVIAASLAAGIAGFGLLAYGSSAALIVVGVALGAASAGAALATLAALVGDAIPPGRQGRVMGAYATAGDAGSAAAPFLAFALLSAVDLKWIYVLCSATFLAGLGLILGIRREKYKAC